MVKIDLKDIIGSSIIDGIEGGRTDSFAQLVIKLKNGKTYFLYGNLSSIKVSDKHLCEELNKG